LRKAALEEAIRKVLDGAQARPGRVKLDLPPLIENGNSGAADGHGPEPDDRRQIM
jgi:hypothetical protein